MLTITGFLPVFGYHRLPDLINTRNLILFGLPSHPTFMTCRAFDDTYPQQQV